MLTGHLLYLLVNERAIVNQTVFEVRTKNLDLLVEHFRGARPFGRRVGVSGSLISRSLLWTPDSVGPNHKRMGEKLARKLEATLALPLNWMDTPHQADELELALNAGQATESSETPTASKQAVRGPKRRRPSEEDEPADQADAVAAPLPLPCGLTPLQVATHDMMVKLMAGGKLPDTACLKLLQGWEPAMAELEAATAVGK